MASGKREFLDVVNNLTGAVSALPSVYFWISFAIFRFFHIECKFYLAFPWLIPALLLSAVAGTFGWRGWYLFTVASVSAVFFVAYTMVPD
jgi:hypothetical protein